MPDTKRVREIPDLHKFPEWLLDDVITTLTNAGILPHYNSDGATVTAADASDLATSQTLTLALVDGFVAHGADTGIHSVADAALDVPAQASSHPAEPADLAEVQATLNQLKADLNTHLSNETPHRSIPVPGILAVSLVTTADATNQTTANALANALKSALNRHVGMGMADFLVD